MKALLDAGASDYLQADTFWAGGLSEMVKICTLASLYDIPVIAHGHSVPANAHLTMAMPELLCPLVEYLVKWNELLQFFWKEPSNPSTASSPSRTDPARRRDRPGQDRGREGARLADAAEHDRQRPER
jgi:L-alanine-DL-glutamate epimerase-like enolase superfamily enzyme